MMNSTNNDSYKMAAAKVFSDLYALIKKDEQEIEHNEYKVYENKIDNKDIISNTIDDKPKQINLLDLNKDIINIIGDFVNKDNLQRERDNLKREREEIENVEQIINGKKIIFRNFCGNYISDTHRLNTKEDIKQYLFNYVNEEFPDIKTYAKNYKIRLNKDDKSRCAWVLFKRCKLILA
jgi:hypothetical protein